MTAHDHANGVASVIVRHLVRQLANEEKPASIVRRNAAGTGRVWNQGGVETFALVLHDDLDDRGVHLHGDVDPLVRVHLVPIHDGIGERFAERNT